MKRILFTIALMISVVLEPGAEPPFQPQGFALQVNEAQPALPAEGSPRREETPEPGIPPIREQGEAGAQGEKREKADENPRPGIPAIREQEEVPKAPGKTARPSPETASFLLSRPYRGSELRGRGIKGLGGEDLGEIIDTIIGRDGRVEFVLVTYGQFLGIGGKTVAVPYSALRQGPEQASFVVNFGKEKMEQAPVFEQGQWPDFYTENWTRDVRSYYGE